MSITKVITQYSFVLLTLGISVSVDASATAPLESTAGTSSSDKINFIDRAYPTNVYWGDTHLHTSLSVDSYTTGNRRLGPEEAYRFAKGETVIADDGVVAKIRRPLDFLVVADHASNVGVMQGLEAKDANLLASPLAQKWALELQKLNDMAASDPKQHNTRSIALFRETLVTGAAGDDDFRHSVWKNNTRLADAHNDPGKFTAFIGYEWTELLYNLHRVVIFKDDAKKADKVIPFSQFDSSDPEKLWEYLAAYEQKTGGEVLAIPHNANFSKGFMFALDDATGNPLSKNYAKTRSRWEPLLEVTQTEGDSETHPALSPSDEFADFETMSGGDLISLSDNDPLFPIIEYLLKNRGLSQHYPSWVEKNSDMRKEDPSAMRQFEYARSALKLGLKQQAKLGVNPFKFGMIGSTDAHTSLPDAEEDSFLGFVLGKADPDFSSPWKMNAAGYAGVWAEENTREALFAAMKRKEVYASTGPRMTVRFFGGWNYQSNDAFKPDLADIGYTKGVPMGGDLTHAPDNKSPQFLIRAVKDPRGANLDRVQVIKGWHDSKGELHEKIYDVALSDNRKPNWRGKVKPVGNTVELSGATYTNTIGDPELATVWQDPAFNPSELAFYYVRVLEIPTPRWTAFDSEFFDSKDIPKGVPMVTQERAYTSPIWYSPAE